MTHSPKYSEKRKHLENDANDLSQTVASHYNKIEAGSIEERVKSRIFYLRNFNNWIKSILINDALYLMKRQGFVARDMKVLDLASGKGGDQLKWKKADVKHVVFADIAEVSMEHCRSRYESTLSRRRHERDSGSEGRFFSAEFIVADCSKERLREHYRDPEIQFDLVSCQFSLHYAFESMSKARCMLRNAAENLRPGGYFIGTIPDAYEIVRRAREEALANGGQTKSFGNEVYRVTFEQSITATDTTHGNSFPLFGAKYHFSLEGVVNCPEFLVYFPLLEELAREHGLSLHRCQSFAEFFDQSIARNDGRGLISRMQALEPFPPGARVQLMSSNRNSYAAAEDWLRRNDSAQPVGTLSKEEWEAASFYLIFMFVKEDRERS